MKFQKLRLTGFKSFCEATEFLIEPGLTGVVGPNGCGKSNLVEALRWVMGENSYKNMRASGMDDVIFSGSGNRPARNLAEVVIVLDNSARLAPAGFNEQDVIEVSRRIMRESGSTYRINGREVRARDVQLLFADASSGARSPAMVRQGQIGEIIAARPQARRRILEEAAGVAGLHSRRHEAELRLKAAEDNLVRLEDVMGQIDAQIESLKRQSRQALRYRGIAADIRRHEGLVLHITHSEMRAQLGEAEAELTQTVQEVAARTLAQGEAARAQGIAAHVLPPLRDKEAAAGATLQRLVMAREALDSEERRARERGEEIIRRLTQLQRDLARETALIDDAASMLARLAAEDETLAQAGDSAKFGQADAIGRAQKAESALAVSEAALASAQAAMAELNARRASLEASLRDESQKLARHEAEVQKLAAEHLHLQGGLGAAAEIAALAEALAARQTQAKAAEQQVLASEGTHTAARQSEAQARQPHSEAERAAQKLEMEVQTLHRLLARPAEDRWAPVVEVISVARGYEAALAAALGDDMEASVNPAAPAHWALLEAREDPALPGGVEGLARHVTAPPALARRLAQIGLVDRAIGPILRAQLKPGQRLVSRQGDLWRWDGFSSAAEAPSPAARRLAEKNRLADLRVEAEAARAAARQTRTLLDAAQAALRAAAQAETDARNAQREAQRQLDVSREKHGAAERARAQLSARLAALTEGLMRVTAARDEAAVSQTSAQAALGGLAGNSKLAAALNHARATAAEDRTELAEARGKVHNFARDAESRSQRRADIAKDREDWRSRSLRAKTRIDECGQRISQASHEQETLANAPDEFLLQRRALMSQIDEAEVARRAAADARIRAEADLTAADRAARAAIEAMGSAREAAARAQANVEARQTRHGEILDAIARELETSPQELAALAGLAPGETAPPRLEVERRLEALKADRERLGAVNLRAETELAGVEASKTGLEAERDDLTEAIKRLRQAISSLNREGRERLLAAFDVVNGHFKDLFTTLFGGGEAELQLVESDDPLEAGLEILARPPGKKPQTMTLLSGGEQALTALSLIFAVFLTNPSPICVLDEVDAPLDDANVERFCDLLDAMAKRTDTRFLTITHNPITMARMSRLFGVTMAERGVSQLVSVDLGEAERFAEAG